MDVHQFVYRRYKHPEGAKLPARLLGVSRTLQKLGYQDSPTKQRATVAAESTTWEVRVKTPMLKLELVLVGKLPNIWHQ